MALNKKDLMRYDASTFEIIPLHRPKAKLTLPSGVVKEIGKAPLHAKWTTKQYDSKKVLQQCIDEERNAGVRLTDEQLVIDVDPRNGGKAGFANLCHDLGIDEDKYPRVYTGSGGWHCYMSKPADLLVRDTLDAEEYAGVEFKSKGRQVVAAGSIHPNGKPYKWSSKHPRIEDGLPKAPRVLINIIKRPPRSSISGGGQYTPDQIANALSKLDVSEFDSNDKWFPLMQACHHASAGDARQEFVDWSTSDPAFAKDAYMIGKRWDSLHADRNDGVTYRTLNKILRDNGAADAQAASVDEDEFPDDQEDGEGGAAAEFDSMEDDTPPPPKPKHKVKREYKMFDEPETHDDGVKKEHAQGWPDDAVEALDGLNRKYVTLFDQGKFRIMYKTLDPEIGREYWTQCARYDFETMYANRKIERDMDGLSRNAQPKIALGEAWIQWPSRRTVDGLIFEPDSKKGERDNYLNLWSGWAMEPDTTRKGSWKWMRELISDVISDGDEEIDAYIMNWIAMMFQEPSRVPGTALVFRGTQGVGKGTLGNALIKMIGQHAMAVGSSEYLTGRFNAHFRNLIFLFADEVRLDRAGEMRLRHLVTEPMISIEKKGVDIAYCKNRLHAMLASNESWVVPVHADERRWFATDVSPRWKGKQDKWDALHAELQKNNNSGYRTMMADLLTWQIPDDWNVRDFPATNALTEQKIFSMSPIRKYFYNCLQEQRLPFTFPVNADWAGGEVNFFLSEFKESYGMYCKSNDMHPGASGRSTLQLLKTEIKNVFPSANVELRLAVPEKEEERGDIVPGVDGKALAVRFPDMTTAAREFEVSCGLPKNSIKLRLKRDHGFG